MHTGTIHYLSSQVAHTSRSETSNQLGKNASLLSKAGYISQLGAGLYSLRPLGLRVLHRIEQIVRDEMNSLGASEFLSPIVYPRELWDKTGRWDSIDVLYKVQSRAGAELCISATAEEVVAEMVKGLIQSYRDLPLSMYQIQSKCRDELRARSGLVRGREFRMKDLYSFHLDSAQLDQFYEAVCAAYMRVFNRCGIGSQTVRTFASGGVFSRFSDEFQLICESGEDSIFINSDRNIAMNAEVAQNAEARRIVCGESNVALTERRAIELGNTFKLGTRFTDAFNITVHDASGVERPVLMCSYGIGTTRLIGAIAEVCSDERGLLWSKDVAPYDAHILVLGPAAHRQGKLNQVTELLRAQGMSALVDNREDVQAGQKLFDADLIGVPLQIIIGNRSVDSEVEAKSRSSGTTRTARLELLADFSQLEKYLR